MSLDPSSPLRQDCEQSFPTKEVEQNFRIASDGIPSPNDLIKISSNNSSLPSQDIDVSGRSRHLMAPSVDSKVAQNSRVSNDPLQSRGPGSSFMGNNLRKSERRHVTIPTLNLEGIRNEVDPEPQFHASEAVAELHPFGQKEEECMMKDIIGINSPTYYNQQIMGPQQEFAGYPEPMVDYQMEPPMQPHFQQPPQPEEQASPPQVLPSKKVVPSKKQKGSRKGNQNKIQNQNYRNMKGSRRPDSISSALDSRQHKPPASSTISNIFYRQPSENDNGLSESEQMRRMRKSSIAAAEELRGQSKTELSLNQDSQHPQDYQGRNSGHRSHSELNSRAVSKKNRGQKMRSSVGDGDYELHKYQKLNNMNLQYYISTQRPRTGFLRMSKKGRNNLTQPHTGLILKPPSNKQLPSDNILRQIVRSQSHSRGNSGGSSNKYSRSNSKQKRSSHSRELISRLFDMAAPNMPDQKDAFSPPTEGFVSHPLNFYEQQQEAGEAKNATHSSLTGSTFQYLPGGNQPIKREDEEDTFVQKAKDLKKYAEFVNNDRRAKASSKNSESRNASRERQNQLTMTGFGLDQMKASRQKLLDSKTVTQSFDQKGSLLEINGTNKSKPTAGIKGGRNLVSAQFTAATSQLPQEASLLKRKTTEKSKIVRASTPLEKELDQVENKVLKNLRKRQRSAVGFRPEATNLSGEFVGSSKTTKRVEVKGAKKPRAQSTTGYRDGWLAFQQLLQKVNPSQSQKDNLLEISKIYSQKQPKPDYEASNHGLASGPQPQRPTRKRKSRQRSGAQTQQGRYRNGLDPSQEDFHYKFYRFLENEARMKNEGQQPNGRITSGHGSMGQSSNSTTGFPAIPGFYQNCIQKITINQPAVNIRDIQANQNPSLLNFGGEIRFQENEWQQPFSYNIVSMNRSNGEESHKSQQNTTERVDMFSLDEKLAKDKSSVKAEVNNTQSSKGLILTNQLKEQLDEHSRKRSKKRNQSKVNTQQTKQPKPFSDVQIWKKKVAKQNTQGSNILSPSDKIQMAMIGAKSSKIFENFVDADISLSENPSEKRVVVLDQKKPGPSKFKDHGRIEQKNIEKKMEKRSESLDSEDQVLIDEITKKLKQIRTKKRASTAMGEEPNTKGRSISALVNDHFGKEKVDSKKIEIHFGRHVSDVQFEVGSQQNRSIRTTKGEPTPVTSNPLATPVIAVEEVPDVNSIEQILNDSEDVKIRETEMKIRQSQPELTSKASSASDKINHFSDDTEALIQNDIPIQQHIKDFLDQGDSVPGAISVVEALPAAMTEGQLPISEGHRITSPQIPTRTSFADGDAETGIIPKEEIVHEFPITGNSPRSSTVKKKNSGIIIQQNAAPVSPFEVRKSVDRILRQLNVQTPNEINNLHVVSSHSSFIRNMSDTETMEKSQVFSKEESIREVPKRQDFQQSRILQSQANQLTGQSSTQKVETYHIEVNSTSENQAIGGAEINQTEDSIGPARLKDETEDEIPIAEGQEPTLSPLKMDQVQVQQRLTDVANTPDLLEKAGIHHFISSQEGGREQEIVGTSGRFMEEEQDRQSEGSESKLNKVLKGISSPQMGQSPYPDLSPVAHNPAAGFPEPHFGDPFSMQILEMNHPKETSPWPQDQQQLFSDQTNSQNLSVPGHPSVPLSGSIENTPKISVGDGQEFYHSYDDRDHMNGFQIHNVEGSATPDSVEESFYGIPSPPIRKLMTDKVDPKLALLRMANSMQMSKDLAMMAQRVNQVGKKSFMRPGQRERIREIAQGFLGERSSSEAPRRLSQVRKYDRAFDDRRFMATRADPSYDLQQFVRKKLAQTDKYGLQVEYHMEVKHAQKQVIQIDRIEEGHGKVFQSRQLDRCLSDVYNSLMMGRFKRIIMKSAYLRTNYHKIMLNSYDINFKFCEHIRRKQRLRRQTMANFDNITRELEQLQTAGEVSTLSKSSLEARRQEKRKKEEAQAYVKANKTIQGLQLKQTEIVLLGHFKQRKKVGGLQELVASRMQINQEQEADEQAFAIYASYIDLVWHNKNNKPAFVTLLNPTQLDFMTEVITLFDAKTKAGILNVYEELDWRIIEAHNQQFFLKERANLARFPEEFLHAINIIYESNAILETQNSQANPLQDILIHVHPLCMESLSDKFRFKVRQLPLVLKYKIGLCLRFMTAHINQNQFNNRIDALIEFIDLRRGFDLSHINGPKTRKWVDEAGLTTRIQDYKIYTLTIQDAQTGFSNLLFKRGTTSLFKKLYDPDMDFPLRILIDRLSGLARSFFTREVLDRPNNLEEVMKPIVPKFLRRASSRSVTLMPSARDKHHLVSSRLFQRDYDNSEELPNSDIEIEKGNDRFQKFKRQGAIDRYNREYCEFQIIQQLEHRVARVKDSMNMFYNRVETLINLDDPHYNDLSHMFGYKCCFIRNLAEPNYLYETYFPIMISKGQAKLARAIEQKGLASKCKSSEKGSCKKVDTACNNIYNLIQNDGFDTDESMKGMELDDLKSELSDDLLSNKDEADGQQFEKQMKPKKMTDLESLLKGKTQTPIEYYTQMRERRESETRKKQMQRLQLEDTKSSGSRTSSAKRFLQEMLRDAQEKERLYMIESMEHMAEDEKSLFYQKNKIQIDNTVSQALKAALRDNFNQIKDASGKAAYVKRLMDNYIESHGITREELLGLPVGRMLEKNFQELDLQAKELAKRIQENCSDEHRFLYTDYFFEMNVTESSKMGSSLPFTLQTSQIRTFDDRASVPGETKNSGAMKRKSNFVPGSINESVRSGFFDSMMDSELLPAGSEVSDLIVKEKVISERANEESIERSDRKRSPAKRKSSTKVTKRKSGDNSFSSQSIHSTPPRDAQQVFRKSVSNWVLNGAIGLNLVEESSKNAPSATDSQFYSMVKKQKSEKKKQALAEFLNQEKSKKGEYPESDLEVDNEIKILKNFQQRKNLQRKDRERRLKRRAYLLAQLKGANRQKKRVEKIKKIIKTTERQKMEKRIADSISLALDKFQVSLSELNRIEKVRTSLLKQQKKPVCPWRNFEPLTNILAMYPESEEDEDNLGQLNSMATTEFRPTEESAITDKSRSPLGSFFSKKPIIMSTDGSSVSKVDTFTKAFRKKMLHAVITSNVGLMEDALNQYQGKTDFKDANGNTLVSMAAMNGDDEMVKLLLSRGLRADTRDRDGNTPLHYAMSGKHLKVIDTLITHGVDENVENRQAKTPWELLDPVSQFN